MCNQIALARNLIGRLKKGPHVLILREAGSLQLPLLQLEWRIIASLEGLVTVLVGGKLPLPSIEQGAAAGKGGDIGALGLGIEVVPNIKTGIVTSTSRVL